MSDEQSVRRFELARYQELDSALKYLRERLTQWPEAEVTFKFGQPVRPDQFTQGARAALLDAIEYLESRVTQ